ncbi:MAG: glycosyl hydrolase-related protein, partial [Solirubrobacterales bacterium]
FAKLEKSWAEHTRYIEQAQEEIVPLAEDAMQALAKQVSVEGRRIVVFNPLPWSRDGVVRMKSSDTSCSALQPVEGGGVAPVWMDGNELCFVARDIPPMGYRTFVPADATKSQNDLRGDAATGVIENEFLKVTLDPKRDGIRSVIDKRTGRELVDLDSGYAFGQYLYERFDANQVASYVRAYVKNDSDWAQAELGKPAMPPASTISYRAASPRCESVDITESPVSISAQMHASPTADISHAVTTRVILSAGEPYIDLEVTLHDKPADNWPEAGWICLPVNADEPQFRLGRLGGIADPARDFVRGSNRDVQAIHTGLTIADRQGRGVGICPIDNPLASLDRPGLWRYSRDFVPHKPIAFVNLFNNQWTTNFRLWNESTWTARVRLWAFDRFDARSSLITPSLEARYPLLATAGEGKAGTLPPTSAGLEISARGTLVTAFGPNPDGSGIVLRLWEYAGVAGPCKVRLPQLLNIGEVQPVNLRGEPTGTPLPVEKGEFTVNLAAFAPASFVIRNP